jgi:hypothetical protein
MMWHVGQRVRCIRGASIFADPQHHHAGLWEKGCTIEPQYGSIYTIRKIFPWKGGVTFWLNELDDPFVSFHEEMFVPVEEASAKRVSKRLVGVE